MSDRYGGPACILLVSAVLTLLSQMAVFAATGYAREAKGAPLVSTRATAELLWFLALAQLAAVGLAWLFFGLTHFVDPGSVELNQLQEMASEHRAAEAGGAGRGKAGLMRRVLPDGTEVNFRWCWHCSIWRPPMANHCPTCNRCFLRLDHHCPWTGNCIAAHNIRYFWTMLAFFGLAGLLIPVGLVAFLSSAIVNKDHVHIAVIAVGIILAAYLILMFGGMWLGASVMCARTLRTVLNPRSSSKSTDEGQTQRFELALADEKNKDCCSACYAPCRLRRH
jgi:hypothetical protein